eukprot:1178663-Prorocentrum_minimum.AAC.3
MASFSCERRTRASASRAMIALWRTGTASFAVLRARPPEAPCTPVGPRAAVKPVRLTAPALENLSLTSGELVQALFRLIGRNNLPVNHVLYLVGWLTLRVSSGVLRVHPCRCWHRRTRKLKSYYVVGWLNPGVMSV